MQTTVETYRKQLEEIDSQIRELEKQHVLIQRKFYQAQMMHYLGDLTPMYQTLKELVEGLDTNEEDLNTALKYIKNTAKAIEGGMSYFMYDDLGDDDEAEAEEDYEDSEEAEVEDEDSPKQMSIFEQE